MPPEAVPAGELDGVVALIAEQQAHPERLITYVGTEPAGIRAELDELSPPWGETVRGARDPHGHLVGAVVVEWDADAGRAWFLGPWVAGDAVAWEDHADDLLDAALAQVPPEVTEYELSGGVANALLGELADGRGWTPTEANHAMVADAATAAAWPDQATDAELRPPEPGDAAAIAPMHEAEFPGTYLTAQQLVAGDADASRVTLIAEVSGDVVGYGSGRVQADGEGFIDFVAVEPAARGHGLGRQLVVALTRELLGRSGTGRVSLTVQESRTGARSLYERLGFRPDGSFIAYRSWLPPRR